MSQPLPVLEYTERELDTSAAGGNSLKRNNTTGKPLSDKEIQKLLQIFENYLLDINLVEPENTEVKITANNDKLLLMYTIGRCNPPHEGHIQLFIKTIDEALAAKARAAKAGDPSLTTRVIFFLGSGPNGGERTSKDPLDFKTKKTVIEYLLSNRGERYTPYNSDGTVNYEIREKDYKDAGRLVTPTGQLVDAVTSLYQDNEFTDIQSQLVVGDKDGDATKLQYMTKSFDSRINQAFPGIHVVSEIIPIEPIQGATGNLSATEIRDLAWKSKKLEDFDNFNNKTKNFYGAMAETVYDGINAYSPEPDGIEQKTTKIKSYRASTPLVGKTKKKGGSRLKGTKKGTKRRLKKGTKKRIKRRNNN